MWRLMGQNLSFSHGGREFFWQMPRRYRLPHPALLNLAEFLLLRDHGIDVPRPKEVRPPSGKRVAVAYSGGVDSHAALRLLRSAIPVHTRVAHPSTLHKPENALLALRKVRGLAIITDSDELPRIHSRTRGFYGNGAWTVPSVLLAEHLKLGFVADGNVLETAYLYSSAGHGTRYSNPDHADLLDRFRIAGLEYAMPCAGLTEVATTRITAEAPYVMGCMRGVGGKPCGGCAKCYRKSALNGHPIPVNPEQQKRLDLEIIPMLPGLLWARDHHGLRHPRIDAIERDVSWADKWYPKAIELLPNELHGPYFKRLRKFGIEPMRDVQALESWVSN
jgi:hypothetical protein